MPDVDAVAALTVLRRPFPPEVVGLLPKVTCKACSNSPTKECGSHRRSECTQCHNYITSAHIHLDYVGHAAVTDRLLTADPGWTWEPVAKDPNTGMPLRDNGNLWIRLTVAGITRLGVGDGSSLKECIGDAIRNAAMRFGVALDLWTRDELESELVTVANVATKERPAGITSEQLQHIFRAAQAAGLPDKGRFMEYARMSVGHPLEEPADLTEEEAQTLIAALEAMATDRPAEVEEQQAEIRHLRDELAEARSVRPQGDPVHRPSSPPEKITTPQKGKVMALFTRLQILDRDERLEYCGVVIGRKITSTGDMTKREASQLIEHLNAIESPVDAAGIVSGDAIAAEVVEDDR
jgi:hypothetical protein